MSGEVEGWWGALGMVVDRRVEKIATPTSGEAFWWRRQRPQWSRKRGDDEVMDVRKIVLTSSHDDSLIEDDLMVVIEELMKIVVILMAD